VITQDQKAWIDSASYEELLRKWRFAPAGEPLFVGDVGEYYSKKMTERRDEDETASILASKRIGWDQ
jgi:hypothetical protein